MAVDYLGRLVRLRRVSLAALQANEATVLRAGEPVFVTETGEVRIGDGTSTVVNLPGRNTRNYRNVSATYTATRADDTIFVPSGTFTLTLPSAVLNPGKVYTIRNIGAGTVTVASAAGTVETTSVAATTGLVKLASNGTNWYNI